ncbi:MAG: glycosyltransferase [Candidatus Saccharimonas aalborgensis]
MSIPRVIIVRNAYAHDFGGGERFPVFLAQALKEQCMEPIVVSAHRKTLAFADSSSIRTIHGLWWKRQNWSGRYALLFPAYLLWQLVLTLYYIVLFARLRPLAVHLQSKDDFVAGTVAGKLLRGRVVWTDHADLKHIWRNLGVWYKNPVGKLVYAAACAADHITLVSEGERREVTALLPKESSVLRLLTVIHNGCADRYELYPQVKHVLFTFVVASRLVADKGITEAIDAFKSLHTRHPDTELVIAGDGPGRGEFEARAHDNAAIHFLGHQEDPYAAMRQGDVFLQPTYHEGFSVALVEASMLGMPIIATDVGGNVEIIHHKTTGLTVPAKDSGALAEAMELLYRDRPYAQKLGAAARAQYLDTFVFDQVVKERFMPLYETIN